MQTLDRSPHDENISEAISYDLAYDVVPKDARRGPIGMGLLWLATQTTFSGMFIGFSAQQSGQPFHDLLWGGGLGTARMCI